MFQLKQTESEANKKTHFGNRVNSKSSSWIRVRTNLGKKKMYAYFSMENKTSFQINLHFLGSRSKLRWKELIRYLRRVFFLSENFFFQIDEKLDIMFPFEPSLGQKKHKLEIQLRIG